MVKLVGFYSVPCIFSVQWILEDIQKNVLPYVHSALAGPATAEFTLGKEAKLANLTVN